MRADGSGEVLVSNSVLIFSDKTIALKGCFADFFFMKTLITVCSIVAVFLCFLSYICIFSEVVQLHGFQTIKISNAK